eukprot:6458548-Amphidinium_carterae.1
MSAITHLATTAPFKTTRITCLSTGQLGSCKVSTTAKVVWRPAVEICLSSSMAAPVPSKGSVAAKKGVDTKRRLREANSQVQAIAVSANVAKDSALEDAAEALIRDLKQDPVLLFT